MFDSTNIIIFLHLFDVTGATIFFTYILLHIISGNKLQFKTEERELFHENNLFSYLC